METEALCPLKFKTEEVKTLAYLLAKSLVPKFKKKLGHMCNFLCTSFLHTFIIFKHTAIEEKRLGMFLDEN